MGVFLNMEMLLNSHRKNLSTAYCIPHCKTWPDYPGRTLVYLIIPDGSLSPDRVCLETVSLTEALKIRTGVRNSQVYLFFSSLSLRESVKGELRLRFLVGPKNIRRIDFENPTTDHRLGHSLSAPLVFGGEGEGLSATL